MPQATARDSFTSESRPGSGFHAKIKGAGLADLVQMMCLSGAKLVVRVTSGNKFGHLYFRGGALVHAVTPSSAGEPAALEMLAWNWGTFEPAEREWGRDSISSSWQSLLMRAAQIRDEREAGSVVALRADGPERRAPSRPDHAPLAAAPAAFGENVELAVTPLEVCGHMLRAEDFQLYVRMNGDGKVAASHGSTQALAGVVAYAARLAQLVGEQLGLEGLRAMECAFEKGQYFVVLEEGGGVVVLEPRASAEQQQQLLADSLRELLGL
jgi:hypothetical protein